MNNIEVELKEPINANVTGEKQPTSVEVSVTKVLSSSLARRQSEASSDSERSGGSPGNDFSGSSSGSTGCDDGPEPRNLAPLRSITMPLGEPSGPIDPQGKRKKFQERRKQSLSYKMDPLACPEDFLKRLESK